ncbi:MAG TPA: hypothetical protein VGB15_18970 [Longimicrobium sp.]
MKLRLLLLLVAAALSACGSGGDDRAAETEKAPGAVNLAQSPGTDCSAAAGDSARAVCLATRPEFPDTAARRVFEVVRRGDTICVHTGPGELRTDDEARVLVVRGAVVETTRSDSIGCR